MAVMRPDEEMKRSVRASVRNARNRLASLNETRPGYRHELMLLFARRQLGVAMGLPLLATILAAVMSIWIPVEKMAVWLGMVLMAKALLLALSGWFIRQQEEKPDVRRWQFRFMIAELVYSLSWASLSAICIFNSSNDTAPYVVAFVALILMLSLRTMMAGPVASIVYMGTVPVTLAILFGFVLLRDPMFYALATAFS